jgi:hypothetical protein
VSAIAIAAYGDVELCCTKRLLDEGEPVKLVYAHPDAPGEERCWDRLPLLVLLPETDPGADPLDSREGGPQHARLCRTRLSGCGGHDSFPGKIEPTEGPVLVYCGDDRPLETLLARPEGQPNMNEAAFRAWTLARG